MTEPRAMEIPPMLDLIQWIQEHGTAATAERIAECEKAKGLYARGLEAEEKDCCALHDEVADLEQQLQAQQKEIERLKSWKAEQLQVESEWDAQKVGQALDIPLGASIRANILPRVLALQATVTRLKTAIKEIEAFGEDEGNDDAGMIATEMYNIACNVLAALSKPTEAENPDRNN